MKTKIIKIGLAVFIVFLLVFTTGQALYWYLEFEKALEINLQLNEEKKVFDETLSKHLQAVHDRYGKRLEEFGEYNIRLLEQLEQCKQARVDLAQELQDMDNRLKRCEEGN